MDIAGEGVILTVMNELRIGFRPCMTGFNCGTENIMKLALQLEKFMYLLRKCRVKLVKITNYSKKMQITSRSM